MRGGDVFLCCKKGEVLMKGESDRMNEYHDMYDRMAKRCLMLSNRAIIQFINGIYEVNHPLDSEVTYNWTEHEDDDLRKTLADTIITIGGVSSYHLEFQMSEDYEVSCKEIDLLVDLSWNTPGVIGSRITGGGFGGCTVSIVKNEAVDNFIKNVGEAYKEKFGYEAEFYVVDIGVGASRLDV